VFRPDFQWARQGRQGDPEADGTFGSGASTTRSTYSSNSIFASKLGDGPTFWLSAAFRLMQMPLGIFGVARGNRCASACSRRMAATGNPGFIRSELSTRDAARIPDDHTFDDRLIMTGRAPHVVIYQHGARFDAYQAGERRAPCASTHRMSGYPHSSAGERVLCDRSAQDTHVRELQWRWR